MASGKKDSSVPPSRRRPAPTIDLKATEIASEPVQPSQPIDPPVDTPPPEARPQPAAAAFDTPKQPAADTSAQAPPDDAPSGGPESPKGARPAWTDTATIGQRFAAMRAAASERLSWPLFGAGLIGAGATLCVLLALWALGAFRTRDDLAVTLAARLAILELQVRDLAGRPQPAALDQRALAELAARVGAAEQAVGRLAGVEAGVARLETAVAAPRPAVADQALAARIAALETALRALAELGRRVDASEAAARDAKSRADAAMDAAQKSAARPTAPAADQNALAALAAHIAALEKTVEQRAARPAAGGADQPGRIAFVAVALRAAAERGDPFTPELSAAKALAPNAALLAPLEPYAATGVPRAVTLARELSQVATPMLSAAGPPREGGIIDRLQQNAERLVRIRPISEGAGDEPGTIVARAEVKATHGDIAGALAELARLPEAARAPAQGWIRKAEMQVAALAAARRFAETAVDALAKAEP
jgi:hypothetical protein